MLCVISESSVKSDTNEAVVNEFAKSARMRRYFTFAV